MTTSKSASLRGPNRKASSKRRARRVFFETLESRSLLATITGGTGPGGFYLNNGATDLAWWLQASSLGVGDNGAVTTWSDESGYGRHLTTPTNNGAGATHSITLQSDPGSVINGNPVVAFEHMNLRVPNFTSTLAGGAEIFIAANVATDNGANNDGWHTFTGGNQHYLWSDGNIYETFGTSTRRNFNPATSLATNHTYNAVSTPAGFSARVNNAATGGDVMTHPASVGWNTGATHTFIGRGDFNNIWVGNFGEIVLFRNGLNTAQKAIVANYLSARYATPMAAQDFYTGDNATIPGGFAGDYDSNAFGIGRVDASNQVTTGGQAGFGIEATTISDDGDFVLAGHKTATNALIPLAGVPGVANRWSRSWYVDVTDANNNLGATLAFDYSDSGIGIGMAATFALLRSTDGGATWSNVGVAPTVVGDQITFNVSAADLSSGVYTLGDSAGPVLTATAGNTSYAIGNPPVTIDAGITVVSGGNPTITGATVAINGFVNGNADILNLPAPVGAITGSYNNTTGVLTLSGSDTAANYQLALRSVTFSKASFQATPSRTVTFTATDGAALSGSTTRGIVIAASATSDPIVWDGNSDADGDGVSWTDPLNWQGDIAPDSNDIAVFSGLDPGVVSVPVNTLVGSISMTTSGGAYTINSTGGGLLLTIGAITQSGTTNNTISAPLTISSPSTALTFDVNTGTQLNVSSNIGGVGDVNKIGLGTLQLSGTSNYTGATNANFGTLKVVGNSPSVPINLSGTSGGLNIADPAHIKASSSYTPDGRLPQHVSNWAGQTGTFPTGTAGNGPANSMWLSNNTTGVGTWIAWDLGSSYNIGSAHVWNYNEGAPWFGRGVRMFDLQVAATAPPEFGGAGVWTTVQAAVDWTNTGLYQGTGAATYTGFDFTWAAPFNTQYIRFNNTQNYGTADAYTGLSEIIFYTQGAAPANPIPDGSAVTVAGGATLDLSGTNETIGSLAGGGTVTHSVGGNAGLTVGVNGTNTSFSGVIQNGAGTMSLTKVGSGTQTVSGVNTYTGATSIQNGVLQLAGGADRLNPATQLSLGLGGSGGTLDLNNQSQTVGALNSLGSGTNRVVDSTNDATLPTLTVNQASGSSTYNGILGNAGQDGFHLVKTGGATLTLGGASTFTGKTSVLGGVLSISSDANLGTAPGAFVADQITIANGATLQGTAAFTVNGNRGITLGAGGGVLGSTSSMTVAGRFTGGTGLTKVGAGDVILTNTVAGTAPGIININAGRLFFDSQNALGTTQVNINNGGTLDYLGGAALVLANPVTIASGGNIASRNAQLTSAAVLPTTGTLIINQDDTNTNTVVLTSNIALTGDLTIQVGGGGGNGGVGRIDGIVSNNFALTKTQTGVLHLANGGNSFGGQLNVNAGTVRATQNGALGTIAGGTVVASGGTLEFSGVFDYTNAEPVRISGAGFAGVGAINKTGGAGAINTPIMLLADASIGSGAGSLLTINPDVNLAYGHLTFVGAGDTLVNGRLLAATFGANSLANLNALATGDYSFTAASQTFNAHVDQLSGTSWLMIGRGRQGWEFDTNGQGALASVSQQAVPGTDFSVFTPAAYSDAIVNDLLAQSAINNTGVEIRLKRATNPGGTAFQEVRWQNFPTTNFTMQFSNNITDNNSGFISPITMQIFASALSGAQTYTNTQTGDAGDNDGRRVFTWPWGGHASQRGFSYGGAVNLVSGSVNTNFLWENGGENHEIPYTEIYIRSLATTPVGGNRVNMNGAGTVTLAGDNTYAGVTSVSSGTLLAAHNNALGAVGAGTVVNPGGTLGLTGGVTITGETIQAGGTGAAGRPGAIANVLGNNTIASPVTGTGGEMRIGSTQDTLTISGNINMTDAALSFNGAGDIAVTGVISQGAALPMSGITGELEIWLDATDPNADGSAVANGAVISNWQDKSGKDRDFNSLLGDPNYVSVGTHGMPAINFDGDDALRTNLTNNNPRNFIDGNGEFTLISVARYSGGDRERVIAAATGHNWLFGFHGGSSNRNGHYDGWGSLDPAPVGFSNDTNWHLHANQMNVFSDVTNPAGDWWRDGVRVTDDSRGTGDSFANNVPDGLSLGGYAGLAEASTAEVSELLMYNRVLSDAELNLVQAYLNSKYSLGFPVAAPPPASVIKMGTGTVTLSGNNTYAVATNVTGGTLVAAHANALGTTAAGTTVASGATLGLSGGITLATESLTINGTGAAGRPGALIGVSGNNTISAATPINVVSASAGNIGLGSINDPLTAFADTFTINAPIDVFFNALTVDGSGDTVLNGNISATTAFSTATLSNLDNFTTGDYSVTAASQTFDARVDVFGGESWLLIGHGREGWDFDLDGPNSSPGTVNDNLGNAAAFAPTALSHTIIRDLMAQAGMDMTGLEVRIRRAGDVAGTQYQESRWRGFTGNGNLWTWDFDDSQYGVTFDLLNTGGAPGAVVGVYTGGNTRDFDPAASNGGTRIFTWPWGSHNNLRGFSYGSSVQGTDNNSPTSFLWEFTTEGHSIPYTEVYIRRIATTAVVPNNQLIKNGAGSLTLAGSNTFAAGTTVNAGRLLANNTTGSATGAGAVVVNNAAVLGGTGSVAGNVTLNNSAVLSPGTNTQVEDITIGGSLTFANTSSLYAQIAGSVAGTGYDQVIVGGGVTIAPTATLGGITNVSQAGGTNLTLINNTSGGAISGNFANAIPPSPPATVALGARSYNFNYSAGTGSNDFVLTSLTGTLVWDGLKDDTTTSGDNNWTNPFNWVGDVSPVDGDTLVFGDLGVVNRNAPNNDFAAATTFTINVTNAAGSYTFGGNSVALIGTGLTQSGAATNTVNIVLGGASGVTISAGTLVLNGANTYTGATTINGGVVQVSSLANGGAASNLGQSTNAAANLVLNGGTLQFTGNTNNSTDRLLTLGAGGGTITTTGTGTLTFSNNGAIAFAGAGNRTLTLSGTTQGALGGAGEFNGAAGAMNTFGPSLADPAGADTLAVAKTGAGVWVLPTANAYEGGTQITTGHLAIRNSTGLGAASGAVNVAAGAQLALSAHGLTVANPITLNGLTSYVWGSETLVGALVGDNLGGGGNNTLTGTLTLAATSNISTSWNDKSVTFAGLITGPGGLRQDLYHTGNGPSSSFLTGTVANSYGGGTTVNSGILRLGNGGGSPTSHVGALGSGLVTVNAGAQVWLWIRTDTTVNTIVNDFALNGGTLHDEDGVHTLTGTVTLTGDNTLSAKWANKTLTVSGQVTGSGRVFVNQANGAGDGGSRVVLSNLTNNYAAGTEHVAGALAVPGTNALGSNYLAVKNGAVFEYTGAGADSTTRLLWLDVGASVFDITNAAGSLTWNPSGGNRNQAFTKRGPGALTMDGAFSGGASITVSAGTLNLNAANTNTGVTTINGGRLNVNGSLADGAANPDVIVNSGGTLGGTGTVNGTVGVNAGGTVAPGLSPGVLNTGSIAWTAASNFNVEVNGLTFGTQYDQLNVAGTVALGGATLNLTGTHVPNPAALQSFVIINNNLADAVTGIFAGLPEGSSLALGGGLVYITYQGGDGNDVVLNSQPVVNGTAGADSVTITPTSATTYTFQFNANPAVNVTGSAPFTFNGQAGDDYVQVNANAFTTPQITYDGGGQDFTSRLPNSVGDLMSVIGTGAESATYTPSATTPGAGVVNVNGLINFTGLEPVDFASLANFTLTLPGANDILTVANGTDAATGLLPAVVITGTSNAVAIESAHLRNIGTTTINTTATDGDDAITFNAADGSAAAANLTHLIVTTGAGATDVVNVNGAVTVLGDVTISSRTIAFGGGSLTAGAANVVTLTASNAITDAGAGTDVTADILNATAVTGIALETSVNSLTATTSGGGNITLGELNGVTLTNVNAANGNVTVAAGGAMIATSVTAGGAGDMILSVTAGGIAVGVLDAAGDMIELSAIGGITDGDAANDVTAADLLIVATAGVASLADPLETTVAQLAVQNSVAGDIGITNTGALNLTTLSGSLLGTMSSVSNPAGAITIVALSPLSVNIPVSAAGAVTLTATDSGAAGDDLAVNATVTSTGSSVTLNAGDNATIGANLAASTTVAINIDAGDADALTGATLNIAAAVVITATGATFTGANQADAFNFAPQATTPINVFGMQPVSNPGGDSMLLDTSAATNPTLNLLGGQGAGLYSFGNRASVQYASIENATTTTPIHIALDATATLVDNLTLQRSTGGGADFEVYNTTTTDLLYAGPIGNVLSFLFLGSTNANTVTIDDVNGLVDLAGAVPAPTGVGDNTNVAGVPEIFLRGNGGTDAIVFANTIGGTNQTYGLGAGTGPGSQAGEVLTANGVNSLSVYFDGMEGVTSNDATPGDVGTLTVVGDLNANVLSTANSGGGTTINVAGGYVPFTFAPQAFNAFTVNAGDGNDSITIDSLNPGETNLAISLNGENNDDTISVGATPAAGTLSMQGGVGNDAYQLGGPGNLVDNILIPVTISDPSGTDSLTVNDSADLSGDTVTITATTIDGINSASSPNITFGGIESLDVTTSGAADTITTTLAGPNNLATVNIRGAGGDDDFFLNLADGLASPTTLNLIGEAGSDDFGSAMSPLRPTIGPAVNVFVYGDTTAITTNPGGAVVDHLFLDMATSGGGTTVQPLVIVDTVGGTAIATNTRVFRFGGIDDIDLYNGTELTDVQVGDVYMLGSSASERFVLYRDQAGMMLKYNGMASPLGPFNPLPPNGRMVVYGGPGNDYMEMNFTLGAAGASFNGGADNDTLVGGLGNDTLAGGAGNDTLRGGEGGDRLFGEDAPSTASAMPVADQRRTGLVFSASGGNDSLDGGGGNDFVFGGIGDDNLIGGLGDDYVHGGDGNDTLNSMGGNDILRGEAGADLINGDTGADIIVGGAGDDRLFGRGGRDFMLAGAGADQIQDTNDPAEDVTVSGILATDLDAGWTLPGSSWTGLSDNDLALQALMFTGPNAWNGAMPFATRVGNLTPFTAMTTDGVADIILGSLTSQDYIISNTADMRLNTMGDLLLTL